MRNRQIDEPWNSFLAALDAELEEEVNLHCIGGFVVSQHYGLGRTTIDLDFINVVPYPVQPALLRLGGIGSALHRKYRIYLDSVNVAEYPENYESRLAPLPGPWAKLRLWVLEPHDLALSKLQRNTEKDLHDVMHLANQGLINAATLEHRYRTEMRPYLVNEARHDTTLQLWIEACWPQG